MSPSSSSSRAQILLPALAGLAVAALLLRRLLPELSLLQHPLIPLWCAFVLTYVGAAAISLLPAPLGRPIDRLLDKHLGQWGAGVYGLIGLSVFLRLEAQSLIEGLQEMRDAAEVAKGLLRDWLIGFSIESLKNVIAASIWPVQVIRQGGVWGFLGFLGACSAVFEIGRRWMPELQARLEAEAPEAGDAKASKPGQ
ncbi:hypothetical protein [Aquimonas voraii]|uniref:Uncharacterized protein n=1 Tax=Aquimonas voraii TaxID=265719 RepID=A0A1G6WXF0_9GAMM|nr:hypothetical protein [Aquimonas voraii]SDD69857.1 hypothetical protein SAMN04488509_105187 [Aquimonas voraii]